MGMNGRTQEGSGPYRYMQPLLVYPSWGRVSTVGLETGQLPSAPAGPTLGATCNPNLPLSRMLPFGLWLFLFSLEPLHWDPQAPHLWQMSPRSLGLTSLSRRLGLGL